MKPKASYVSGSLSDIPVKRAMQSLEIIWFFFGNYLEKISFGSYLEKVSFKWNTPCLKVSMYCLQAVIAMSFSGLYKEIPSFILLSRLLIQYIYKDRESIFQTVFSLMFFKAFVVLRLNRNFQMLLCRLVFTRFLRSLGKCSNFHLNNLLSESQWTLHLKCKLITAGPSWSIQKDFQDPKKVSLA